MHDSAWSNDLTVEVGGHGVVSHAGSAVLRLLADRTGLTGALSRALRRRGFPPVHDRGRVLVDAAVCIADGGRVLSDLAALRDQAELFGPVASDATLWRALEEIGDAGRARIATARARTRRRVWTLIAARHGRIPPSRVADVDLGKTVVIRLDATIQIAHSDKQRRGRHVQGFSALDDDLSGWPGLREDGQAGVSGSGIERPAICGKLGIPSSVLVVVLVAIWSSWASFWRAPVRLICRPSTSPSQPSRRASAMRACRLSRISISRGRCAGSGRSSGHRRHACSWMHGVA